MNRWKSYVNSFYQIKCEMQKCGNVFFIFHPFRIPVMTRGIKTSGPKKRPVIGCPSFWLLALRKQVSPGIQTLNLTLGNQINKLSKIQLYRLCLILFISDHRYLSFALLPDPSPRHHQQLPQSSHL